MDDVREVMWEGDSKERLRGFPDEVKWAFGRALYKAQLGKRHPIGSPVIRDRYRDAMDHCHGKREER